MKTDIERWGKLNKSEVNPSWHKRNDIIAQLIPQNVSVLDIGAGNRDLERKLTNVSTYSAVDCVGDDSNTIIIDFNAPVDRAIILEDSFDIAVCSGVLEYIIDPNRLLRFVTDNADASVLTYVFVENRITANDSVNGWVPGLSRTQLAELFKQYAITVVDEHRYGNHTIMLLQHGTKANPWLNS